MKSKSRLEGSLLGFVLSGGAAPKALIILMLGFLLLMLGNLDIGADDGITEEEKISEICAMTDGVGECRTMVTYTSDGSEVYAVTVLCRGADSAEIRGKVTSMICSLYGIGAHRVTVMKLAE